jgi:hypothetical protein
VKINLIILQNRNFPVLGIFADQIILKGYLKSLLIKRNKLIKITAERAITNRL